LALVALPAGAAEGLFLEVALTPERPYVQQRVHYTVRVFRSGRLQTGVLLPPEPEGVVVEPVGEPEERRVERDGRRYYVQVHRFLLLPQESGRIRIPPPVFSGRQVFARGPARELVARPVPAGMEGDWWLPALDLTLSEQWSPPLGELRVGEAPRQSVTVTARGLTAAQLPEVARPAADGWRVYPAGQERTTRFEDGEPVARRTWHRYWVPERAGTLALPAATLSWWDTGTERVRHARLARRTLEVQAAGGAPSAPAGTEADAPARARPPFGGVGVLDAVAAAVAALLAVALGGRLLRRPLAAAAAWRHRRDLRTACRSGSPEAVRAVLLRWGRGRWPRDPPRSLAALAPRLGSAEARAAVAALERAFYGPDGSGTAPDCTALEAVMRRPSVPSKGNRSPLPPLNPPVQRWQRGQ